jgi:hypothetical protein
VSTEATGWRELTELVTNHVLSYIDRDEFVTVMDSYSVTYEVRRDN